MNIKKICKILSTTTAMLGLLAIVGIMNNVQAHAEENVAQNNYDVTTSSAVSVNDNKKNDYSIDVNSSIEKEGFKLTIKNVVATKHNLKVKTVIESSKLADYNRDSVYSDIIHMTVKNAEAESFGYEDKKIEDDKIEYTFDIVSYKGFDKNTQLRFDVILPQYDLNAWVEADVDISKYFDKVSQSDINFNLGRYNFYKAEADVSGMYLYYKEEQPNRYSKDSYENRTWDSQSKVLLKCNDKIYELDNQGSFVDDDTIVGFFRTDDLFIDDMKSDNNLSIIPVKCNITYSEREKIFDDERNEDEEKELEENNVIYNKELKFMDNSKGVITKAERNEDKVKLYISSSSDKNSLLIALSMYGYYEFKEEDKYDYDASKVKKIIYKNPDDEFGYVVEFDNVINKDRKFKVHNDSFGLSYSDKYDIGEEIKLK